MPHSAAIPGPERPPVTVPAAAHLHNVPDNVNPVRPASFIPSAVPVGGGPFQPARLAAPIDRDPLAKRARAWLRMFAVNPAAAHQQQAGGIRLVRALAVRTSAVQSGTEQARQPQRIATSAPRPWDDATVIRA